MTNNGGRENIHTHRYNRSHKEGEKKWYQVFQNMAEM